jgi:hypothetical protein
MNRAHDEIDVAGAHDRLREGMQQQCRALFAIRRGDSLAAQTHLVNAMRALHSAEVDLGQQRGPFRCV